jgi:hypothetical protein
MPSSTSSSNDHAPASKYDRLLPRRPLGGSFLIAMMVAVALLAGWEMHWRSFGVTPSYRNSNGLWAMERRRIDKGEGNATVIIGSSRALFNTQLDVWERESGERPIQLALEGTSPVSIMEDLADDPDFTGTLIVGVAPGLFFGGFEYRRGAFDQYLKESPSQWLGQRISMLVEPLLAFYSYDYGLFTVIKRQPWPERDGVETEMDVRKLVNLGRDRNARMWSKVETDPEYQALAKEIWADGFVPIDERDEEWVAEARDKRREQIDRAVAATRKLREKGVDVVFVRNPAEGHYAVREPMYNPRQETWDVLIEETGVLGLHWEDHEAMQGYWLPEWSHMSASEADRYTEALYHLMQKELAARAAKSAAEVSQ